MKIKTALLALIAIVSSANVSAQDSHPVMSKKFDEQSQAALFKKTYWIPKRGVILLNESSSIKAWEKMREKECIVNENILELRALNVFRTEHLYIFNFENYKGYDWIVCRKDGAAEFHAEGISGGYAEGDPKKPFDTCSSGATNSEVRFRSYEKDGPLLLEVHVGGCRGGEAHHEFLFRLDKETLQEIPGSRLVMHDYFNKSEVKQGWMWTASIYSRLGKSSWNDDGNLVWERSLRKHPMEFVVYEAYEFGHERYQPSFFLRTCSYNSTEWRVICTEKLTKKSPITNDLIDYYLEFKGIYRNDKEVLRYLKSIKSGLSGRLKDLGYYMEPEELKELNRSIKLVSEKIKADKNYDK